MSFDFLDMKMGNTDEEYQPTELHNFEAQKGARGKGLERKVSPEEKEKAHVIVEQFNKAKEILEKDKQYNYFTDGYDVFDQAEKILINFYPKEVAKKMAQLYQVTEEINTFISEEIGKNTLAGRTPDRRAIWEDVTKVTRGRLEKIKLKPAEIEVILEDLYDKKKDWVWETKMKLKPLPEQPERETLWDEE